MLHYITHIQYVSSLNGVIYGGNNVSLIPYLTRTPVPKTVLAIATALGCKPELESKTLLLKTPSTSDTGFEGIKLELA